MASIRVQNVGKAYKQYRTRWGRLLDWVLPDSEQPNYVMNWVLKDVSFDLQPGEAVGIVGRNGAGKSTLLKMIVGTSQPTVGSVAVSGRVAALLELGMGFHPDFTGRQNVYLSAQLQGLSTKEVGLLMEEIEKFSDIGDYIDQPVRVYSSGMQVRLAFAVATARRPDVLIVDEALAVGDAAFQRKCFARIESYLAAGTALLFVTHDTATIKRVCTRALYLNGGRLRAIGDSKSVCDLYEGDMFGQEPTPPGGQIGYVDPCLQDSSAERQLAGLSARIESVEIREHGGRSVNVLPEGEGFLVVYSVAFLEPAEGVHFGFMLRTVDGVEVYGTNTDRDGAGANHSAGDVVKVEFALEGNLMPGVHYLSCAVSANGDVGRRILHKRIDCLIFKVVDGGRNGRAKAGLTNLKARHQVMRAEGG